MLLFHLQVHVVEGITQERFSNLTNVTIFIQDVNDNSPKFEENVFEFEVEEEVIPPLFISQVCLFCYVFSFSSLCAYWLLISQK